MWIVQESIKTFIAVNSRVQVMKVQRLPEYDIFTNFVSAKSDLLVTKKKYKDKKIITKI